MPNDIEKEIKGEVPSEEKEGGFEVMSPEEVERTEAGWRETQQELRQEGYKKDIEFLESSREKISPPLESVVLENVKESLDEKWGIESEQQASEGLVRLKGIMSKEDYQTSLEILRSDQDLFDTKGKLLHATNSFALNNILESGKLSGGLWQKGPSFTNGDSRPALTFNLIWEDLKTKGGLSPEKNPKKVNSDKYFNKKDEFVAIMLQRLKEQSVGDEDFGKRKAALLDQVDEHYREQWDIYKTEKEFNKGLKDKIYGELMSRWQKEGLTEKEIEKRKNELLQRAEVFKKQLCQRPSAEDLERMHQVTLIVDKKDLPEAEQGELTEWQRVFEVRPEGEVGLEKVSTIFVPFDKIGEIREKLKDKHPKIEIRPSEELEIIRMLEKEKYSPEVRKAEIEHKIEKIKAWAEQSGLKENEDFLVIKGIGDVEENKESIAPHERYVFFMAVHEKHYKEFRDYILGQYKRERKEENPESDVKIDYSWGGRFFVYNDGLSALDTAPALHIENIENIEKTVVHTHHKEFKESFRKKSGFEFPSAETLNPILKEISGEGLASYKKAMDKLEEMEKLDTLSDEGYGLKNGLEYAIMILEDAKRGKGVVDLPETIYGKMPYKIRHYNDLTYNADYLIDLDRVSKITNIRFSDRARIDKIFERWGFDRKKMEDVCRDFAEHLMDRRSKESK